MGRTTGLLSISANFEPNIADAFDPRLKVDTLADLSTLATFGVYSYVGMVVSVNADGTNNGVYRLTALPHTIPGNWEAIGGGAGTGGLTPTAIITTSPCSGTVGYLHRIDTEVGSGSLVFNMPVVPTDGDLIGWMDVNPDGSFQDYPVILTPPSGTLLSGFNDTLNLDVDKLTIEMMYNSSNSNWVFYENPHTPEGGLGVTGTPERQVLNIDGTTNTVDTDYSLYLVPASAYPASIKIAAVNRNSSVIPAIRIAHVDGVIGDVANEDYIWYDVLLQPNEPKFVEIDGMIPADSILVRSDTSDVNFIMTSLLQESDTGLQRISATTVVADTDTTLVAPSVNEYENCSVLVCNKDAVNSATYRVALIDGVLGDLAVEDYFVYDEVITENEGFAFSEIFHIPTGYTLAVRASDADVNFIVYGRLRS